jgi:hypothetical protein
MNLRWTYEYFLCMPVVKKFMYETKERTASVVWWPEFLATDPEVLGSIPGASRFSDKQWVWNGVHSAS